MRYVDLLSRKFQLDPWTVRSQLLRFIPWFPSLAGSTQASLLSTFADLGRRFGDGWTTLGARALLESALEMGQALGIPQDKIAQTVADILAQNTTGDFIQDISSWTATLLKSLGQEGNEKLLQELINSQLEKMQGYLKPPKFHEEFPLPLSQIREIAQSQAVGQGIAKGISALNNWATLAGSLLRQR